MHGFEITSTWITFRPLYKILRSVEAISEVKRNWFNDNRITFKFRGEPCIIYEPWGDSSRYWVGPENAGSSTLDITSIHQAFQRYRSPIARAWTLLTNSG
ncbi:MAG: hypothetical protein ACREQP_07040 [Candidatus Binatia bacterium]